ncbi:MAG TPA: hypothetical protein DCS67_05415 [Clostridiales bacterium UBA8960]|nr:hypothetical protein [Clostridiales bacterium UBA8960]
MSTLKSMVLTNDRTLYEKINHSMKFKWFANFMRFITHFGDTETAVFSILVALILEHIFYIPVGQYALLTLVVAQVIVQLTKRLVNRPRPYHYGDIIKVMQPPECQYSFPSGHTACAFALALSIGNILPFLSGVLLVIAVLVGFSRVALGFHYPTDVLIGTFIAYAAHSIAQNLL